MKEQKQIISNGKQYLGYLVLFLVLMAGVLSLGFSQYNITSRVAEAEEAVRPANIEVTLITAPDCENCFDVDLVMSALESEPLVIENSVSFTYDSDEGKALIDKYQVKRIPTLIFKGETDKNNISEFMAKFTETVDDGAILTAVSPVYIDVASGERIGEVKLTYLTDSRCTDCYAPEVHKTILEQSFGMIITEETTLDIKSTEGSALVSDLNILSVPTVIISKEANAYPNILAVWAGVGSIEKDGQFIFRELSKLGPITYKDLSTNTVIKPPQE